MMTTSTTTSRNRLPAELLALLFCLCFSWPSAQASATIGGNAYVPLTDVAGRFGMQHHWVEPGKVVELRSEWTTLRFQLHKRFCWVNDIQVFLGKPIALSAGKLHIATSDIDHALRPLLTPSTFADPPKLYHIVIDPGHGGRDPGAINTELGVNEKTTTLDLAKRLRDLLREFGYKVTLTREDDRALSLSERPQVANRYDADLFISLHFNAVTDDRVHGVETYVMTPQGDASTNYGKVTSGARRAYAGNANDPWNVLAGYYVQAAMVSRLQAKDRGVRRARFAVIKNVSCPAILVEGGFVSHPTEGRRIHSAAYRNELARAILSGVLSYQRTLNRVRDL